MLAATLAGVVVSSAVAGAPAPGHNFDSQLIDLSAQPNLPLLEAAPYPARRVDDPRRAELGRLWVGRSPSGHIVESVYGLPGAIGLGADPRELDRLIYVRTDTPLPDLAVSPWQTIGDREFDEIRRRRPWVSNKNRAAVIGDLRRAQDMWLSQHGYIRSVRTHVNPATIRAAAGGATPVRSTTPAPSGVLRFRAPKPVQADDTRASVPDHSGGDVRVSVPDFTTATIVSTPAETRAAEALADAE